MTRPVFVLVPAAILVLSACAAPEPTPDSGLRDALALAVDEGTSGPLDEYWAEAFSQLADTPYDSPSRIVPFEPTRLPREVACVEGYDDGDLANNALYCPTDMTISYDVRLARDQLDDIGRMAPVMILAHEWGHHLQHLGNVRFTADLQAEQMADCLAGAFAAHASDLEILDEGEITASLFTFFDLGERFYGGGSWFDEDQHGTALERARAFGTGMGSGDPTFCLGYQTYHPRDDFVLGPFSLGVPPGMDVEVGRNGELSVTGTKGVAELIWVPDVAPETDAAASMPGIIDQILLQPTYDGASFMEGAGGGLGATYPGSSASSGYVRPAPDLEAGFAHGIWVLHVLPDGGALLMNVEAPGLVDTTADEMWSEVLDLEFALIWQLCVEGLDVYTCPAEAQAD